MDAVAYAYSPAGDLQALTHDLSPNTWDVAFTGAFDPAHRLAGETISKAAYQWTGTAVSSVAYDPDRLNRYRTVAGAALAYDDNANLTGDGAGRTFAYDPENRLLSTTAGGVTWNYAYDPLGRRVSKQQPGGTGFVAYLSDGDEEITEYNTTGGVIRRYAPGPEIDRPVATVAQNGTRSYFHPDRRGSIVAMADDAGALTEGPYSYDAYGAPSDTTGVAFKYTGRRYDAETGLYYYRARYYSSGIGRFLQTDPIGYDGGMNLYEYSSDDPLNMFDPSGTDCGSNIPGGSSNPNNCKSYEMGNANTAAEKRRASSSAPAALGVPKSADYELVWGTMTVTSQTVFGFLPGQIVIPFPIIRPVSVMANDQSEGSGEKVSGGPKVDYPATPDRAPQDYRPVGGSPAKENVKDGSVWEKDRGGTRAHGGEQWKRWSDKRAWEKGKRPTSVWPDGKVRK